MKHIAKALNDLLDSGPLGTGFAGWRAVELWDETVGASIAARSKAVRFVEGRLIVEVQSSAWMQEISMLRADILRRLNLRLRENVAPSRRMGPVTSIQLVLAGRSAPRRAR